MIYLRLAPYIALIAAALVIVVLWTDGKRLATERDAARANLAIVEAANQQNLKVIAQQEARAKATDKVLEQVAKDVAGINDNLADTALAITDLEKANEDVRSYLATVVPDALRRQLEK